MKQNPANRTWEKDSGEKRPLTVREELKHRQQTRDEIRKSLVDEKINPITGESFDYRDGPPPDRDSKAWGQSGTRPLDLWIDYFFRQGQGQ